jgi:hypothetical protein
MGHVAVELAEKGGFMDKRSSPSPDPEEERRLRHEHERLERQLDGLLSCATSGDWRNYDAIWEFLSERIEEHMDLEERLLFPAYGRSSPEAAQDVAALIDEHRELRRQIRNINLELQRRFINLELLEGLSICLRAHAGHERRAFYPWLSQQPPHGITVLLIEHNQEGVPKH